MVLEQGLFLGCSGIDNLESRGLSGKVEEEVGLMLGIIVSLWKMIHADMKRLGSNDCCPANPDF